MTIRIKTDSPSFSAPNLWVVPSCGAKHITKHCRRWIYEENTPDCITATPLDNDNLYFRLLNLDEVSAEIRRRWLCKEDQLICRILMVGRKFSPWTQILFARLSKRDLLNRIEEMHKSPQSHVSAVLFEHLKFFVSHPICPYQSSFRPGKSTIDESLGKEYRILSMYIEQCLALECLPNLCRMTIENAGCSIWMSKNNFEKVMHYYAISTTSFLKKLCRTHTPTPDQNRFSKIRAITHADDVNIIRSTLQNISDTFTSI